MDDISPHSLGNVHFIRYKHLPFHYEPQCRIKNQQEIYDSGVKLWRLIFEIMKMTSSSSKLLLCLENLYISLSADDWVIYWFMIKICENYRDKTKKELGISHLSVKTWGDEKNVFLPQETVIPQETLIQSKRGE